MEQTKPAAELPLSLEDRETELSELAANLQRFAESERVLLARQLHDELGGALVGAKMDLAWLRRKTASTDPDVLARFERLERALETGIAFKRRVVEQLRPTLLDNLGFYAAARWLVEETCAASGLKSDLELQQPEPQLTKDVGIALFRVLQESLLNVTRHAHAHHVSIRVTLASAEHSLRMTVQDDGVGLNADRLRTLGSHGLGSMRHRMHAIAGHFDVKSVAGQGTEIAATAPTVDIV